jgi:polyisoprenyl-phosphate glycosyltransferase
MVARKIISILTPCYNEQDGIRECYARVRGVLETRLPLYDFEHVFIDNCSQDATVRILKEIASTDPRVKIIVNSRNFGLSRSPYHGMLAATGDCVIPIVADLQTPPECIVEFVEKWEQGFKMVIAVRTGMEEGFVLKLLRSTFYRLLSRMSRVTQIQHFIGFGLFDRQVVDILRDLHEPDPYFRGLVSEIGFEKAFIYYHQPARRHGKSRHSFLDLLELSMLALTTYSKVPIRMMTLGGLVIACGSITSGIVYFILKIIFWNSFPVGFAPLIIGTFFLSAINLLALGLVGEYVGLILQYSRRFPLVIEQERVNFVPSQVGSGSTPLR